ncbi:MAG: CocE/NonD family hydrolase [Acidobacteria bacterium]|nr:CocE/NonD family hydrolase [Acidobacteriota bacterium]
MKGRLISKSSLLVLLAMVLASRGFPQGLEYVKANYTKHEFSIPMRDGIRLFTAVYMPKDRSTSYPILLKRTPYSVGPYGSDRYAESLGPSLVLAKEGYIFVYQDVRGRWMSEGEFEHVRPHRPAKNAKEIDESTDTYDTIDWLLKNIPGHNGRAGMWGISYPGFYAAAGSIDAHPALKAVSPQAPVADWFASDDWHHNGAFLLAHAFGWFSGVGWPFSKPSTVAPGKPVEREIEDAYEFFLRLGPMRNANERYLKSEIAFWNEMMKRETRDDWWKARNIRAHLKKIKPAVMTVGGWFDAENLFGALEVYRAIEAQSPGNFNILVMGPWVHGGWEGEKKGDFLGDVRFDAPTGDFYRERIELPFFNYFLKDKGKQELPEAYVFETGTNQWRKFETWPPKSIVNRSLYLRGSGRLAFDPPPAGPVGFDEYISDPAKPVPFIPGLDSGMAQLDDQRFASRRTDVLVYQTALLEEDTTVAGPIVPSLHVSTSGTDSDWIVKLIDVYPDRFPDTKGDVKNSFGGYQQLVRGDVMRGKFRNSLDRPEPFVSGQPVKVEFTVPDTFHTFRRGHRIMIQIQSSWFPLININPQRFLNINEAAEADFEKASQRVYRSSNLPSSIKVSILPRSVTN